jgi:peptidyl-prolyl cis-trans isomerase C
MVSAQTTPPAADDAAPTKPADAEPTTQPAWEPPVPLDSVVATVDGAEIVEGDILDRYKAWMEEKRPGLERSDAETWDAVQRVRAGVLRVIIDEQLLNREVDKAGITVSDEELRDELEKRIEGLMMARGITRAEFEEMVSTQANKPFPEVYQEQLDNPRFRQFLLHWKLIEQLHPDMAEVPEEDVEQYYQRNMRIYDKPEEVKASHILIKVDKNATDEQKAEARAKLEKILEEARTPGADFAALAKENSDCPSSARGGDLGFFPRGKMVKEFSDVAFNMDVGDISDIIETQFGYHIITVTDKRPAKKIPYEEAKYKILHLLKERAIEKAKTELSTELKEKADIVYTNPDDEQKPPPPPPSRATTQPSGGAGAPPRPAAGTVKTVPPPNPKPAGNPGAR